VGCGPSPPLPLSSNLQQGASAASPPQSSAHAPVSLGILLDTSVSMTTKMDRAVKMDWAVDTMEAFINSLDSQDEAFLLTFSRRPTLVQPFTDSHSVLNEQLATIREATKGPTTSQRLLRGTGILATSGLSELLINAYQMSSKSGQSAGSTGLVGRESTALYDAVLVGLDQVILGKHTKKALLVITDGIDTASRSSFTEVLQAAEAAKVPIYSIIIGDPRSGISIGPVPIPIGPMYEADPHDLQVLGEKTKGASFLLNPSEVSASATVFTQALDTISQELHEPTLTAAGVTYRYDPQQQIWERVPPTTGTQSGP
jgi:VWFA-related protein